MRVSEPILRRGRSLFEECQVKDSLEKIRKKVCLLFGPKCRRIKIQIASALSEENKKDQEENRHSQEEIDRLKQQVSCFKEKLPTY